ncbi:peptidoglycan DD-metalloendopeptidase family protein [Candidatus Accumulibacter cognatus]|uniref:Murein hydrolase activator NlpD n=1 Tax=Candidatus Accumulibacter cognatus TaxID=2954383 RepID=A0A080M7H0_9PROT|nr:peptidoglycan DD-metalloendopeptidase family protein [Candidatus Accumulibacter cognatus]KFB77198.1 MAG: Murein hydrolase activator NlpD precursor [Candidatus Accumulibacter cognatus]
MKDQGIFRCHAAALALLLVLAGCASITPAPLDERSTAAKPQVAIASKDMYLVKKGDTLYSIALDHGLDYRDLVTWNAIENPNRILIGQALRVRAPGSAVAGETAVVRPIGTVAVVEQRPLGAGAAAVSAAGDAVVLKREPKAGKEAYSEQALARAQAQPKPAEPAVAMATVTKAEAKPEAQGEARPGDTVAGGEEITWTWPASGKLIGTFSEGGNKGIDINGKAGDAVLAAGGGKVVYSGTGLRGYGKLVIVKHNNTYLTAYAHNQSVLVKEGQSVSKGQKIAEMGNTDADQVKLHFEIRRQGKPVDPLKHLPQR